ARRGHDARRVRDDREQRQARALVECVRDHVAQRERCRGRVVDRHEYAGVARVLKPLFRHDVRYTTPYVNVRLPGAYKWWALSCTSLGMLLVAMNSGTLIIALPDLERSLHSSLLELVWVILAYLISSTVLVLTAGRLSDVFGRKKAYIGALALFAATSLGAGFAADGTQLILWRIVQGMAGAFIFANAPALVADAFPLGQLGVAMGTNTMVAAIGLVIGPVLGGALVEISWHWVFWFNVPVALIAAIWSALTLRELSRRDAERSLDLPGTGLLVAGLTGLVYGISRG